MKQVSWLLISVWAPQCHVRRLPWMKREQVDDQRHVTHVVGTTCWNHHFLTIFSSSIGLIAL